MVMQGGGAQAIKGVENSVNAVMSNRKYSAKLAMDRAQAAFQKQLKENMASKKPNITKLYKAEKQLTERIEDYNLVCKVLPKASPAYKLLLSGECSEKLRAKKQPESGKKPFQNKKLLQITVQEHDVINGSKENSLLLAAMQYHLALMNISVILNQSPWQDFLQTDGSVKCSENAQKIWTEFKSEQEGERV